MSAEAVESEPEPGATANLARWECALRQLEDNLEAFQGSETVSDLARELALNWQPPSDLGPLQIGRAHV